ncbi:type II secretion system minor pseudopilin GspI [Candidatus Poribacteria bacterium]
MVSYFHHQITNKEDQQGFTLLEIVVALTIAAITLPVLLQAFSEGTKNQSLIENKTTALYLLKLKMAEIEMLGEIEAGSEDGDFGSNSRFQWTSDITESDTEGLYEVVVTVNWQERGREETVQLTTLLADRNIEREAELAAGP